MASASSSKSEQSYIRSSLLAKPPLRSDGRAPEDYRQIALETKVTPLANGSARVNIGGTSLNGVGGSLIGTEVLAAVKLEVETLDKVNDRGANEIINDAGRILCNVSWSVLIFSQLYKFSVVGNSFTLLYNLFTLVLYAIQLTICISQLESCGIGRITKRLYNNSPRISLSCCSPT